MEEGGVFLRLLLLMAAMYIDNGGAGGGGNTRPGWGGGHIIVHYESGNVGRTLVTFRNCATQRYLSVEQNKPATT